MIFLWFLIGKCIQKLYDPSGCIKVRFQISGSNLNFQLELFFKFIYNIWTFFILPHDWSGKCQYIVNQLWYGFFHLIKAFLLLGVEDVAFPFVYNSLDIWALAGTEKYVSIDCFISILTISATLGWVGLHCIYCYIHLIMESFAGNASTLRRL